MKNLLDILAKAKGKMVALVKRDPNNPSLVYRAIGQFQFEAGQLGYTVNDETIRLYDGEQGTDGKQFDIDASCLVWVDYKPKRGRAIHHKVTFAIADDEYVLTFV